MAPIPARSVARALRTLPQEELVAFVSELWEAAGWETERDDSIVIAHRGSETRRLLVMRPGRLAGIRRVPSVDEPIDALVLPVPNLRPWHCPRRCPAVPILTATDLRERLLYAADQENAATIADQYFEASLRQAGSPDLTPTVSRERIKRTTVSLTVVVIALLFLGVVVVDVSAVFSDSPDPEPAGGWEAVEPPVQSPLTTADLIAGVEGIDRSAVHQGPLVVFGTSSDGLYGFDPETGDIAWHAEEPADTWRSAPIIANGTVIVADINGDISAIDATTGAQLWQADISDEPIVADPSLVGDRVLIGTQDEGVVVLNASTGSLVWRSHLDTPGEFVPPETDGEAVEAPVLGTEERVFAVDEVGTVQAFSIEEGESEWQFTPEHPRDLPFLLHVDDTIIVSSLDGNISALNSTSGEEHWQTTAPTTIWPPQLTTDGTAVFVPLANRTLLTLDVETGEQRWHSDLIMNASPAAPALTDEAAILPGFDGQLHALDRTNGTPLWTSESIGSDISRPLTIYNNTAFVISGDAGLHGIDLSEGLVIWNVTEGFDFIEGSIPTVTDDAATGSSVDALQRQGGTGAIVDPAVTPQTDGKDIAIHSVTIAESVRTDVDWVSAGVAFTNRGSSAKNVTVTWQIGDRSVYSDTIEIDAFERVDVDIEHQIPVLEQELTYRIEIGSTVIEEQSTITEPARFEIHETVARAPNDSNTIDIEATVVNRGDDAVTQDIRLWTKNDVIREGIVSLAPGHETNVSFAVDESELEPGTAQLAVTTENSRDTVQVQGPPVDDQILQEPVGVVALGILLFTWLAYRRRR